MKKKIKLTNLKKLAKQKNISMTSLAVNSEVSIETISRYISGVISPKTETLIKLAELLNTSTDYLLGLTNNPVPNELKLDERELSLIYNFRNLEEKDKVKIETYIQIMVDYDNIDKKFVNI